MPDGRARSILSVVVVVVVITIVIIIVNGRRSGGRLIGHVIIVTRTLDIIVISLVIAVVVRLVAGARLQGRGRRERLSAAVVILIVVLAVAGALAERFRRCTLTEAGDVLLIVIGIGVVGVVNGRSGRGARRLEVVVVLIADGARPISGRRRVVPLRVLILVETLLRSGGGRRHETVPSLIVVVAAVETGVRVLIGRGRARHARARRYVTVAAVVVVLLLPADLSDTGFLLLLCNLVLVGPLVLVVLILAVPTVVKVAAAAASQVPVAVVAARGLYSAEGVGGGANGVAGLGPLKMVLRLGVAAYAVVVKRLQARTYPVQVEIVAGVVEGGCLAVDVVPVRARLALLVERGVVGAQEPWEESNAINDERVGVARDSFSYRDITYL